MTTGLHRSTVLLTCVSLLFWGFSAFAGKTDSERSDSESWSESWGPAIGTPLPPLRAQDQTGTWRDFDSLKGKRGLLLFMNRSADW